MDDPTDLSEFAMTLYTLVEEVRREHEGAAAEVGLTATQATILGLLAKPASMSELAQRMGCDASNITGLIDRMEAKGLVTRTTVPGDRRVNRVVQTTEGQAAMAGFLKQLSVASPLATLSASDRKVMQELLLRMRGTNRLDPNLDPLSPASSK
jgi:DNA-binding MarR family transcriptional regulator